jgi:hypothetical protein
MPTSNIITGVDGLARQSSTTSFQDAVNGSGNFATDFTNQVANVKTSTTFFCGRAYYQFDTTGISTDQVATAATVQVRLLGKRGGTSDDTENHKLFSSTNHTVTSVSTAVYNTSGDAVSDVVDIGDTNGTTLTFTLDSTGLSYINTQIAAGNPCAFLQRCQNDYQNPSSNPSLINFRTFNDFEDATVAFRPKLSITHDTAVSGFGHNVLGVASANISKVKGVATANIGKVIGVD